MNKLNNYNHMRGIEREGLRVDINGKISQNNHPTTLGSKLINSHITVDFAESLFEFITDPHLSLRGTFTQLDKISAFSVQNLQDDEIILNSSMPLKTNEKDIKIAYFGSSHSGRMKEIYRLGLASRYGKNMQIISGIHYNFSFDEKLISCIKQEHKTTKNEIYFNLINHYFEFMWLLPFLFGASPVCAKSDLQENPYFLTDLDSKYSIGKYSTSLRMSKIGYQSDAQSKLYISYENVEEYTKNLIEATQTPFKNFEDIGLYNKNNQRIQLNSNILQIENEYYSYIRPKQIAKRGERPADALYKRGVEYVEVRVLDVNPFYKNGIDESTALFTEALLMTCLLQPKKEYSLKRAKQNNNNFAEVAEQGRNPDLKLIDEDNNKVPLAEYGHRLINLIEKTAKQMGKEYLEAVKIQRLKLEDTRLTPSGMLLDKMKEYKDYESMIMQLSKDANIAHKNTFLSQEDIRSFEFEAINSLSELKALENNNCECSLDEYIENYYNCENN